jgi:hypothetical protein
VEICAKCALWIWKKGKKARRWGMMKKLSELENDAILVLERNGGYDDICITKEELVADIKEYADIEFLYIGVPDRQKFEWADVFERAEENSFEDFAEIIEREISDEDWKVLERAAEIVNAAYAANPVFESGEMVEIDYESGDGE